jgi:rhamnose transport system substrate-binding protein
VIWSGGISAGNQQDRLNGVKDEISENFPNMQIVDTTWSNDDAQVAFQNAENVIMANPDLDAIIGISGYEPHSAAAAVEEAVKQGIVPAGQIYITGLTLPDVIRQYIKDGTVESSYVTEPAYLAYTAVYIADQLVKGTAYKPGDAIEVQGLKDVKATVNEDKTIYFGLIKLTKDNVDNFSW